MFKRINGSILVKWTKLGGADIEYSLTLDYLEIQRPTRFTNAHKTSLFDMKLLNPGNSVPR